MDKILFMVELGNIHFITYSFNREEAKRSAHSWIGSNPDTYIVTPLTEKGDRIKLDVVLFV